MTTSSLPKHLYLVRTPASQDLHKPSPATMGGKGYNLHRMTQAGLNVPVALVIGTHYTHAPQDCFVPVFSGGLQALQESTDLRFGDERNPLILSVRSGAPVSMPGMLETLLNIGLNDQTLPGLVRQTGNPRMAWDAYRRLVASCRVPDDCIDSRRYPLFMARAVMRGVIERLKSEGVPTP